jgi:hypothetical protein
MKRLATTLIGALASTLLTLPALAGSVGAPAPDFSLTDLAGKPVKLSDYKGKYVVLEWVNPGCPFVQKHYDSGNMPKLQKDAAAHGVVWLTVNSTNPSSQDFRTPPQMGEWLKSKGAAPRAALLDKDGAVGKRYGAKATPHMYVVNPQGALIYAGAIDSIRSADIADIDDATNYVALALSEARAGKPLTTASTQAYGCSIKY